MHVYHANQQNGDKINFHPTPKPFTPLSSISFTVIARYKIICQSGPLNTIQEPCQSFAETCFEKEGVLKKESKWKCFLPIPLEVMDEMKNSETNF